MPESIESSKFASHKAQDFDSREDSDSTKFKQRPQVFAKLSFRELYKLFGLHPFDYWPFHWDKKGQKQKGSLWVCDSSIFEGIFVTFTENLSAVTNNTQGPSKYPHHQI